MELGSQQISIWVAKIDTLTQKPLGTEFQSQDPSQLTPTFIAGRRLLMHFFGRDCLTLISYTPNGKPYFIRSDLPKFNLSHSQDWIALAFSADHEIGVDIEVIRSRKSSKNIIKRYFNQQEQAQLNTLNKPLEEMLFWQYWTAHEAVIKQQGQTVWLMKPQDTLPEELAAQKLQLASWKTSQWCISLCFPSELTARVYFLFPNSISKGATNCTHKP